jgi:hypothetical protein
MPKPGKKAMTMKKFFDTQNDMERIRLLKNPIERARRLAARRAMMYEARKRAKRYIRWLAEIAEKMPNVTDDPGLQFSMIFDAEAFKQMARIGDAMGEGIFYIGNKTANKDDITALSANLGTAHIKHNPSRLFRDREYRLRKWNELESKQPSAKLQQITKWQEKTESAPEPRESEARAQVQSFPKHPSQ